MRTIKYVKWIFILFPGFLFAQGSGIMSSQGSISLFKPEYHFHVGSSFSYFSSFGSGMGLFAVPSVSFPVSKRFSAEGGIIASTSLMPGYFPAELNQSSKNTGTLAVYGSTVYQASPRITIYGTGIKQLVNNPALFPFSPAQPNSFTMGSIYKLTKGITIGASVHVSEGYYYNNIIPGRNHRYYSPFAW